MTISAKLTTISDTKLAIKNAITAKGVDLTGITFIGYPNAITSIVTGVDISDADATVTDVVSPKTFYSISGSKKIGTIVDRGTISTYISIKATEVTIAAGKHSGSGIVKISAAEQAKIIAENIKEGITILGETGTLSSGIGTGIYLVRWIDYNGTILKQQRVNSGGNATPPTPPIHSYLTFSGWNTVSTNITRDTDIGAIYNTTDGKSYLFIRVSATTGLSPTLYINKSTTATMTIVWGDGTTYTISSSGNQATAHTYAVEGDYLITVTCSTTYQFGQGGGSTQIFTGNYPSILKSIYIGANVTKIPYYTFLYCYALTSISIPSSVTTIEDNAFYYCLSLTSISIPAGVTTIGANAFYNCYSLTSISIPSSVTTIGAGAFNYCRSLTSISIPSSVTSIGTIVFYNCSSLTSISIPSSVTTIGDNTFNNCYSLTSISIPSSVTSIGTNAFYYCLSLTSISIPAGVTTIGANAFYNCYSLKDYQILPTTPPTLSSGAFTGLNMITKQYMPDANVAAYKTATNWVTYANYIYPLSSRP